MFPLFEKLSSLGLMLGKNAGAWKMSLNVDYGAKTSEIKLEQTQTFIHGMNMSAGWTNCAEKTQLDGCLVAWKLSKHE